MPKGIYQRTKFHYKILAQNSPFKKGHKIRLSEKDKEKIRKRLRGRRITWGDKISRAKKGQKFSKEVCQKRSEMRKGVGNPNWKGGITPILRRLRARQIYKTWKETVLIRDGFTCQVCGGRDGRLVAHHIRDFNSYPELRFAPENGTVLCNSCHTKFHKRYGYKNTEKQLLDYVISFASTARQK